MYPILVTWGRITGRKSTILSNEQTANPMQSFYNLSIQLNNGKELKLESTRGKKVMLVNTASECGYTAQYDDLEQLYKKYEGKLLIIGFPANDFGEQEPGSDKDIAEFCRINYGVTFPLAQKSTVLKGKDQNEVFKWLTEKNKNGWNTEPPTWNFSKYLVNEEGVLTDYFDPAVSPLSKPVIKAVEK